ncbi:MAG: ATP-grasp domain-containing protein, partial [Promethearchaeota archaeon]
KDCIIITEMLGVSYHTIKDSYSNFLVNFTLKILNKYPKIDILIIGSGLDDAFNERETILKEIENRKFRIISLNNEILVIKKARDIEDVYKILIKENYKVPFTISLESCKNKYNNLQFPFILKKKRSSGGINVYKVDNKEDLSFLLNRLENIEFTPSDWLIQEYIEGLPISCTIISNGVDPQILSINRQIIGERYLNAPSEFMYCGNIVPANLLKSDNDLISLISLQLAKLLKLKGINGFDFVLKDHYPYLMEINPRIPGSIRASESALNLNLLDLHIRSFDENQWKSIREEILKRKITNFTTKLILYSRKNLNSIDLKKINELEYVHDKTDPNKGASRGDPVCTILYKDKTFSDSYFGALKVVDKIYKIIQ